MDDDEAFAAVPLRGTPAARKRAAISPEQFAALPAPQIPCGFFSLTLTDGAVKRFRVRLERGTFLTGKRTLSRYCKVESDDAAEREWETLGTVESDGFHLFKRWRGEWEQRWAFALWKLLNGESADGYAVEVDKRCALCMRELKTPEQVASGLTPGCAKKLGR